MESNAKPTDHRGLVVLDPEECDALLASTAVGRIAFMSYGRPLVLPVTYAYRDREIVFRTGIGAKLEAAARHDVMSFEIDGWDEETRTGWSVVVQGRADLVSDDEAIAELESIGLPSWAQRDRIPGWVRLIPDQITGRRID